MMEQRQIIASGQSLFERPPICPPKLLPGLVLLTDIFVLSLTSTVCLALAEKGSPAAAEAGQFLVLVFVLAQTSLLRHGGFYRNGPLLWPGRWVDIVLASNAASALFVLAVLQALDARDLFNIEWIVLWFTGSIGLLLTTRTAVSSVLHRLKLSGHLEQRVAIVCAGEAGERFVRDLSGRRRSRIARFALFCPDPPLIGAEIGGGRIIGNLHDLMRMARDGQVDEIILALSRDDILAHGRMIDRLRDLPIDVSLAPDISGTRIPMRLSADDRAGIPMLQVWQEPIPGWHRFAKIGVDYILALSLLVLLAPVLVIIAVAIRLDTPGPVLFRQRRIGFNNRVFEILKFRTMYHFDGQHGRVLQASRNDPRVTRVGWFLRRTSLDELPQLLNVLNGTMSLVGPRPHALNHNDDFSRAVKGYFIRHKVRPGITGWAQVNGLRGEIDTTERLRARVAHDTHYAENWSLLFDLRILVVTAVLVLFQRSAY